MMVPGLLLAAALALPLDVVLKVDPAPFPAPLTAEVSFEAAVAGKGVTSFSGTCPWPDPARPLLHRWKAALPGAEPRTLRRLRYVFKDGRGRVVASLFKDPAGVVNPKGLQGVVLHAVPVPGPPGFQLGEHRVELEIGTPRN